MPDPGFWELPECFFPGFFCNFTVPPSSFTGTSFTTSTFSRLLWWHVYPIFNFFFFRIYSTQNLQLASAAHKLSSSKSGTVTAKMSEEASALQMPLFINPHKPSCRYCCPAVLLQLVGSCWNAPCPPFIFMQHQSPSTGKDNQTDKIPLYRTQKTLWGSHRFWFPSSG